MITLLAAPSGVIASSFTHVCSFLPLCIICKGLYALWHVTRIWHCSFFLKKILHGLLHSVTHGWLSSGTRIQRM